jgi:hypothetical protein
MDIFIQQIFRHICKIQNIYAFKCTREIFDIHTIVNLGYEHSLSFHNTLNADIKGHGDLLVQQNLW